jgi:peptide/nickel transport system substrate-binding protein
MFQIGKGMKRCCVAAVLWAGLSWSVTQAATPPQILVVVQSLDDIVSLDPAEGFELSSEETFPSLYQRLIEPDPDRPGTLRLALATGWRPGADGRSIVFELRPDAHFSSGNPVRPEDVVYSLRRAVVLNRSPAFILNELGWTAENIAQYLHVLDARHVQLSWPRRVGPSFAVNVLSAPVASVIDQREAEAHAVTGDMGNTWLRDHSAGSGPFHIRRYIPHEAIVLDATPGSPAGTPYLRTIVIKDVPDAVTRRLLVETGDADIARDLGPDQLASLQHEPNLKTMHFPSAEVHYLLFNTANHDNPALANPALWEAARWLVDYDGLAKALLRGQFSVHQGFLAEGFPGALNTTPYRLDVAKARAILAKGGLGGGVTLQLDVFDQPPFTDIAQSLQASFAQAGIRLQIQPATGGEVYARVRAQREQAVWLYWIQDYFDANSTASAFALNREDGTKTIAWRAGWHIPELSRQTDTAVEESDPAKRERLYTEIQTTVQASSPFVLALQKRESLVMRANVQGYRQGLDADMVYYDKVSK